MRNTVRAISSAIEKIAVRLGGVGFSFGAPTTYAADDGVFAIDSGDLDGDGESDSTEADPSFTYEEVGDYTALLTVTDAPNPVSSASAASAAAAASVPGGEQP